MKLTPQQIEIKRLFRLSVLALCRGSNKFMMFNTGYYISNELHITEDEALKLMSEIPSIGEFRGNLPAIAWLAMHYRPVSDAFFDGKSDTALLTLWGKTKRVTIPRRTKEERSEISKIRKYINKIASIAELRKNIGDRWGDTDWKKVK